MLYLQVVLPNVVRSLGVVKVPVVHSELKDTHYAVEEDVVVLDDVPVPRRAFLLERQGYLDLLAGGRVRGGRGLNRRVQN